MNYFIVLATFLLFSQKLLAFNYFDGSIDYWDQNKTTELPKNLKKKERAPEKKFNWDRYLNPKSTEDLKEVFREGDHTPPAPLLEVAKNPTDENIKKWFKLVEKKNQFLTRLNQKMTSYLKRNQSLTTEERNLIQRQQKKIEPKSLNYKRFRFRMYFESSCPHCKRMMGELLKLQNMGFFVELRQIDDNLHYSKGLPFVVKKASKRELKEKNINAWPVLFIGDQKKKLIYRINGFQTSEEILFTLQNK